ncbi:MAG: DNA replication/repair protein RecF, partial [Agathobaculum sp.]|uniref:DNA replication/repair protein RecF n=1 Tax=Agathobaculum sp. TaxID=2048138 RepID=UPI003D921600
MKINTLHLQNFRNYVDETFALHPAVNLICGENGQGKTNLLEAAAACSTMRLFRTAQKREGLRFGQDHAFIQAEFEAKERDFSLEMRFSRTKPLEIYKNGVRQKRQADIQGLLKTVLFCPDDLLLVRQGAGARRRFLDTALCQLRPYYARYLEEYNRLHEHKTRILRDSEQKPSLLSMWEDFSLRMAHLGAQIIRYRAYYC